MTGFRGGLFRNAGETVLQVRAVGGCFSRAGFYLSRDDERKRYQQHHNDPDDPRYQKFVDPIVARVLARFGKDHKGLDFGAGSSPVITRLLRDRGFSLALYDPFFWNTPNVLAERYDFIVCCEVIEHFQRPARESRLLRSI